MKLLVSIPIQMGVHVKNITHVDVYWQKTHSCSTMKVSSVHQWIYEQSVVGVYCGVDQCLVDFLHHHQVKHLNKLEGALCQVTEVYYDNS